MSFLKYLEQIDADKFEKEARDKFLSRKDALGKMSNWSKNLALSAVPLGALAAFSEPAVAQSSGDPISSLKLALTLEYLEATFYTRARDTGVFSKYEATYDEITKNEVSHVNFLKETISEAGVNPPNRPEYDFTLGGQYQPFQDLETFLLFAQVFEDTGQRAYKGQATNLIGTPYLTPALRIHSAETRHVSATRRIRGLQGWIPGTQPGIPDVFKKVYLGDPAEDNVTQLGLDVTTVTDVARTQVTESFDEPLNKSYVLDLVDPFIISNDG